MTHSLILKNIEPLPWERLYAIVTGPYTCILERLAVAAQDVDQLVLDQLLDVGAGGLQILAGVKVVGMLVEVLTDGAGHGQAQIGVDVDLTHGHGSGLTQLLLGDTHGVGHLAAVLVDHLHILLGHGRGAVENDGEAGQAADDLVQNVEAQGRGNQLTLLVAGALCGGELVRAVAGADGNGQGVAASLGDELLHFLGAGVVGISGGDVDLVLHAGQSAQLSLNHNAVVVGVLHHLLGDLDVLGEGLAGGVDHDGGEAAVDAALAGLEAVAVVQVQADGQTGLDHSGLHQLDEVGVVGVGTGTLGHLQDQRGADFLGGLGDTLNDLHVVDVEGADGVAAVIGLLKHFGSSYEGHVEILPVVKV